MRQSFFFLLISYCTFVHANNYLDHVKLPEWCTISGATVVDGRVEYLHHGNKDIDENDFFEIGSVTKIFTSLWAAMHSTEQEGFLKERISLYLPESKNKDLEQVVIHQLCSHTGGFSRLPPGIGLFRILFRRNDPYKGYRKEDLQKDLAKAELKVIGKKFGYSNFGSATLGLVMENATGMSYESFLHSKVFEPLEMKAFLKYTSENQKSVVPGYNFLGKQVSVWHQEAMAPAGAIKASSLDLTKFISKCLQPKEDKISLGIQKTIQPFYKINEERSVGLGWIIENVEGKVVYWHNGETGGYCSFIGFSPSMKTGVVLLCNFTGVESLRSVGLGIFAKIALKQAKVIE